MPGPQTFSEWAVLGSLLLAAVTAIVNALRSSREEHEREQSVRDKLDGIRETVEHTQATIDRMDSKLDDHGTRIARVEEQISALGTRVVRVEQELDRKEQQR